MEGSLSALIVGIVQRKTVTAIDTDGEALDFTRYEFALVGGGHVLGFLAYSDQSEAERVREVVLKAVQTASWIGS
jgi:hypothetical protein